MSLQRWQVGLCSGHGSWSAIQTCLWQAYEVSLNPPCISPAGKKGQTTLEKETANKICDVECINNINEVFVKEIWNF